MTVHQIDSTLSIRLADKPKESETFVGQFRTYTRILGTLEVRTGKGEIYHEYMIYDNKILKHREVWIIDKHYGDDYEAEEYFYLDNKLVKYQRTIDERSRRGICRKDSITLYVHRPGNAVEPWTLKYLQEQASRDIEKRWD